MKRKWMRCLAAGMAAAMLAGSLTGCGKKDEGKSVNAPETEQMADTSEEVELVMYVIGNEPVGQAELTENMNKIFKEKLNCTLKINYIGYAEFANKYPLLFSSGEEFDIAYTANWLNFSSLAKKGAFMALDELWPKYAPLNFEKTTDEAKKQATLDGHYYCIPTLLPNYDVSGPIYRTDILEGTGWDGKMENFEDLEKYLDLVKENAPEIEPFAVCSAGSDADDVWLRSKGYLEVADGLYIDTSEEDPQVVTLYEEETMPEFLEMMARWNEKGFFSKSALADTDTEKVVNGRAAMVFHGVDLYSRAAISKPEYSYGYKNFSSDVIRTPFTQDAMVISNTSKNPERALMLWDLITSDQEAFDAFYYGIKGVSYDVNEEGQYRILDSDKYSSSCMYAARTEGLNRYPEGTPQDVVSMKEEWKKEIEEKNGEGRAKYNAFVLDTASIETEYAAIMNVNQQYWWPLELGYTDAEKGMEEYKQKMEAAGVEKVKAEVQKQLDEYVAALAQ